MQIVVSSLAVFAVCIINLCTAVISFLMARWLDVVSNQITRFHVEVLAKSGTPDRYKWIMFALGLSCLIVALFVIAKRRSLACNELIFFSLYPYVIFMLCFLTSVFLCLDWLRASVFI